MQLRLINDSPRMDQDAADLGARVLRDALRLRGSATAVLASGLSQLGLLEALARAPDLDWSRVTVFHLDEYIGLPASHPASFRRFLRARFLERLTVQPVFVAIDGDAPDESAELARLNRLLAGRPVDLCLAGIGENGHLAFNDPPADFAIGDPYIAVTLDQACRRQQVGEGWFARLEDVPGRAISMSITQIMRSNCLLVMAPTARKADALRRATEGPVEPACPASVIQRHPHCVVYLDSAAAGGLHTRPAPIDGSVSAGPIRLNQGALAAVAARAAMVPTYPRQGLVPGVVHLGLGAFHRAHQALVFDALLQSGDRRWGVHGVAMHNPEFADGLAAQDGLYAVQMASHAGVRWQVVGALLCTSVAARERTRVMDAIAASATRWLTLTVTEKGYGPELASLLVDGLALRRRAGHDGLTIASCDNLTHNGRRLQSLVLEAAIGHDHGSLRPWIQRHCAFPNSMVDRIVPATSLARRQAARDALGVEDVGVLGTEAFTEWVIERRFADPQDAEALASVGVTVVDDVALFEEAKLGLLNGSHSAMAYAGAVAGLPVIAECVAQPVLRRFIRDLMTDEVAPHLRRPDWQAYRDALLARFANPGLLHSVHQIANDGSQKIPQRWVPATLAQRRSGQGIEHLAFCAAAWMRFLQGVDEHGNSYTVHDPQAGSLQLLARQSTGDTEATAMMLCARSDIWGNDLPTDTIWRGRVAHWLGAIQSHGMLGAMQQLNNAHA